VFACCDFRVRQQMRVRDDLGVDMAPDPADGARQYALGGVVLESAYMEHLLRAVFGALLGSKNGAVVAAGQNAGWLLEQCAAMTKACREIPEDAQAALLGALSACAQTYQRRNRVVHDVWARRPGALAVTLRSQRKQADMTVTARTVPELETLADDLAAAADSLSVAVAATLGEQCLQLENQLRLEQGHDISTDSGSP
jgi:hypothetical protein